MLVVVCGRLRKTFYTFTCVCMGIQVSMPEKVIQCQGYGREVVKESILAKKMGVEHGKAILNG